MNIQKLFSGKNLLNKRNERYIPSTNHFENLLDMNVYKKPKRNLYKTSSTQNRSSNKNTNNKTSNRKQSSYSIKNRKSSKIFKIQKKTNNKIRLSLNLSEDEPLNKNKNKINKNYYNTINVINPSFKIFNKNDFIIKDNYKKNKSIQNSARIKYNNIRCNTYTMGYKENKEEYKYQINKREDKIKQSNNNIIINFFNAPINRYNEEFYFNNVNDANKIINNKQIKKKVLNLFNHGNTKNNHNNNLNKIKNIYPPFANNNNNNRHNDFEFQIYSNKKKPISNAFDNFKIIFDNNSINKVKKSPIYRERMETYSNKYNRIKFIKNKKNKNVLLHIEFKGDNKLKTIFKKTKNYNNINIISKNNIINIKQDHYIRSKTQKKEQKIKNRHILYNLLFKPNLKTEQNNSNKTKSKISNNILSFNRLNFFKSIDVDRNTRKIPKFSTLITETHNNAKKGVKNKFLKKSKAQVYINNNIHYHQKNNEIKTILNKDNEDISNKNNFLKLAKKEERNNKIIKPKLMTVNDNNSLSSSSLMNKDPKYLGEYLDEILCNLFLEEKIYIEKIGFQISSDILNNYGINPETRTCLVDSLIDLQKIFNFNERTLFITVQIFDRYITLSILKETIPKLKEENLDIILTTSLLIASKLEESVLYKLSDYLGILSEKYTIEDIKIMENKIMDSLDFSAVSPTVLDFFEVLAEKSQLNNEQKNRGLFLLNTVLLDINLSQISGSVIAYAIVIIIKDNINNNYKCKNLIEILNPVYKKKKNNNKDNIDAFSLMNDEEKIEELCELILIFAEGILKTEYNHISIKFNCQNNDYIPKLKAHSSI